MAGTPVQRASDGAVFHTRIERGRTWLAVLIPLLLIAGLLLARSNTLGPPLTLAALTGAVDDATPAELTAVAANQLEAAVAANGDGISFEIVQLQTIVARPGGPPVEVPDPADPERTIVVDGDEIGILVQRGFITSAGFWSELRHGPSSGDTEVFDYERAPISRQALVRDGRTYRNDGQGWHETDRPPGIGLDPVSAALLPRLLRELTEPRDAAGPGSNLADRPELAQLALATDDAARTLEATTKAADVPALIAPDLAEMTELRGPARLAFDESGRLIGLTIIARNTHLETWDLIVETVITFAYPADLPPLPEPRPTYVEPTPAPDDETGS